MKIGELCLCLICYGCANSFICSQLKSIFFFLKKQQKKAMLLLLGYPSTILEDNQLSEIFRFLVPFNHASK